MFIKGANDVLCALDVSFGVNPVVGYEDVLAYNHDVLVQESKNNYIQSCMSFTEKKSSWQKFPLRS